MNEENTTFTPGFCSHVCLNEEARVRYTPLISRPEQVGAQYDGDVTGCHLVHSLLLRQQGQELDQVPG